MGTYIHNLAASLIGELRIRTEDLGEFGAQSLYEAKSAAVKEWLRERNPATIAKIARCGRGYSEERQSDGVYRTPMYLVHCGTYLGKYDSGSELIIEIACTAIVAMMCDILHMELERMNRDPLSEVPDREMHRAGL